jgi:hypothetical protein
MIVMDNLNRLREELRREIGLTDIEWDDLVAIYPDIDEDVRVGVEAGHVKEWARAVRFRRRARSRGATASDRSSSVARDATKVTARDEAVSILYAVDAAARPRVSAFRREVLRGRLVSSDRVEDWIKRRAHSDGKPTPYIRVPIPKGFEQDPNGVTMTIKPAPFRPGDLVIPQYDTLDVALPEVGVVPFKVHTGGVLDRLRILADELARRYGWRPGEASTFVLTDGIPLVPSVRSSWSTTLGGNAPTPRAQVVLTVDPAITPNDLRDRYGHERNELFGGRRHRTISEKHLRLAAHDLLQPGESSPSERMAAWNEISDHLPGYRYGHVANYARDAKMARARLTALPLDWGSTMSFFDEQTSRDPGRT